MYKTDVHQALIVLKQDCQDTIANLAKGGSALSLMHTTIDDYCAGNYGALFTDEFVQALSESGMDTGFTANFTNKLISFKAYVETSVNPKLFHLCMYKKNDLIKHYSFDENGVIRDYDDIIVEHRRTMPTTALELLRQCYLIVYPEAEWNPTNLFEAGERLDDHGWSLWDLKGHLDDLVQSFGMDPQATILNDCQMMWAYYDATYPEYEHQPRIISLDAFDFSSLFIYDTDGSVIGTVAGWVTQIKGSIQTQEFFNELASYISNGASLVSLATKWLSNNDVTSNFRRVLDDFNSKATGSRGSALQWLVSIYKEASEVTDDGQGNLSFSSTDFKVLFSWSTIMNALFSAVETALAVITLILQGVFKVIAALATVFITLLGNLFKDVTNPTLSVDEDKRMTLQIPLAQITESALSYSNWNYLNPLKAVTVEIGNCTYRHWVEGDVAKTEIFLKPKYSVQDILAIERHTNYASWMGLYLRDQAFGDDYVFDSQCGPTVAQDEGGQAIILAANLYYLVLSLFYPRGTFVSAWSTNDCKNVLTNASSSDQDKRDAIYTWLRRCVDYIVAEPEQVVATDAVSKQAKLLLMSWQKLCNIIIPNLRELWTMPYPDTYGNINWSHYIETGDWTDLYERYGATVELEAFPADGYGVVTPRNSADGLLLGVIVTLAAVAAVTATVVVTTIKARQSIASFKLKQANKCSNNLKKYQNSLNGIDNDDPSGETPKQYTKAEQTQYFKNYYKSVKAYNRWSILWGGSTWSLVNGWDDGSASINVNGLQAVSDEVASYMNDMIPTDGNVYNLVDILKLIKSPF